MVLLKVPFALGKPENCRADHCSEINRDLNEFCTAKGFKGKKYMVLDKNIVCMCPCSCVVPMTSIDLADGNYPLFIKDLLEGDSVVTPLSDRMSSSSISKMMSSEMTGIIYDIQTENGFSLQCSGNHVFIDPAENTISAKDLKVGNTIVQTMMGPSLIIKSNKIHYDGLMYNMIVHGKSKRAQDHIINTNGIYSGDWLLQINNDAMAQSIQIRNDLLELYE